MTTNRHRVTNLAPYTEEYFVFSDIANPSWSFGPCLMSSVSKSITDTVTPNYRARIARGEIINNPMSLTSEVISSTGGHYYRATDLDNNLKAQTNGTGSLTTVAAAGRTQLFESFAVLPTLYDDAKVQALANIDTTPFAFQEDLFELHKTIKWLRSPFSSLRKLSDSFDRKVKRRMKRKSMSKRKVLNDTYLEYQFAVTPLVQSSFDALEYLTLYKRKKTFPKRLTARGNAKANISENKEVRWQHGTSAKFFTKMHSTSVVSRAQILYEVNNPIRDAAWDLGVRKKDIPATVWAIMPYSFMIDRIVDISSLLKAATNLLDPSINILAASTTLRHKETFSCQLNRELESTLFVQATGDVMKKETFSYDRNVWRPSALDVIPPVTMGKFISDTKNLVDTISLFHSRFGGSTIQTKR